MVTYSRVPMALVPEKVKESLLSSLTNSPLKLNKKNLFKFFSKGKIADFGVDNLLEIIWIESSSGCYFRLSAQVRGKLRSSNFEIGSTSSKSKEHEQFLDFLAKFY